MSYAKAAGAAVQNSSQNGSQSSERFFNKNMVVCFGNGVYFETLAEALDRKGYWSDGVFGRGVFVQGVFVWGFMSGGFLSGFFLS